MGLTPEVMIRPKTLNNWLTMSYGVDTYGYSRMVILDVDSREGYNKGHVPGAHLLENNDIDLWAVRDNGVGETSFQVATRLQMDDIIRRTNIDTDAIVVLTAGNMAQAGRAYFNFRYWGFPRQQLKVLNTTKHLYAAAGFALQTTPVPTPEPCQYSVCSLQQQFSIDEMRASFQEMVHVAGDDNPDTVVIDIRSADEFAGRAGATPPDREENSHVVFEGHIRTAQHLDYNTLLDGLSEPNVTRAKDMAAGALEKVGLNSTGSAFVYGRTGIEAAIAFLAIDGLLNRPVKIYDGGWIQWGRMAGADQATGGTLAADSPWRTDIPGRSAEITYNKPHGFMVSAEGLFNANAARADAINRHDAAVCGAPARQGEPAPPAPGY